MVNTRIAIIHERLTEFAGSEQVVVQLAEEWPTAKIHVPIAVETPQTAALADRIVVSGTDRVHAAIGRRSHAPLLPLFPPAFRRMRFDDDVDAVVISHHAVACAAVDATDKTTVAYVHSPARWAWDAEMRRGEASGIAGRTALAALATMVRRNESAAAPKLSAIVANSTTVRQRVEQWWHRDAHVIHPPVDTEHYTLDPSVEREDFFLLAGRLVPYKRPDLAVAAAARAGARLMVAGDGRMAAECRALAGPETTFLGRVSDEDLLSLQRRARALVMPGIEDFGIVPVEAMACGTPVIAIGAGGALDSVVPGLSGALVRPGSDADVVEGFASALREFDDDAYDAGQIRKHAEQFSRQRFREQMRALVDSLV